MRLTRIQQPRKSITFYAGLALKQGLPNIALDAIITIDKQNYAAVRNLKVLALVKLHRYAEVMPVLRSVLDTFNDSNLPGRHSYTIDVV